MQNGDLEACDWLVIHGDPEKIEPCLVEDCYCDREPYGEYVLFAACDPSALQEGKISIQNYAYLAEVRVSFEADLLEEAKSDITWCRDDAVEQGDGFVREVWPSWQEANLAMIAESIFPPDQEFVMAKSVLAHGEDAASWLELTRIEVDEPAELTLSFCRIEKDRLLEVKAVLKDAKVPVYRVAEFWSGLVERFVPLVYQKYDGARRVEPESRDTLN